MLASNRTRWLGVEGWLLPCGLPQKSVSQSSMLCAAAPGTIMARTARPIVSRQSPAEIAMILPPLQKYHESAGVKDGFTTPVETALMVDSAFATDEFTRAQLAGWQRELGSVRRLSANTLKAYGRDLDQFLSFLAGHTGGAVTLTTLKELRGADIR